MAKATKKLWLADIKYHLIMDTSASQQRIYRLVYAPTKEEAVKAITNTFREYSQSAKYSMKYSITDINLSEPIE